MNMAEAVDELDRLIQASVAERMSADVPVGVFLSGGIELSGRDRGDAALRVAPGNNADAGHEDPRFNEADHARAIAKHLGSNHIEEMVTAEQALAVVTRLGHMYDEPLAGLFTDSDIPRVGNGAKVRDGRAFLVTAATKGLAGYRRHFATPKLARQRMRKLPMRGAVPAR